MDIGQPSVDPVVTHGQATMIDPQLVQDRGVDIVNLRRVFAVQRLVTPGIAFAKRATPDPAAAKKVGEHKRIVIAPQ